MIILGIETSCDDTSVAVFDGEMIKSTIVSTQVDHVKYGGIIPEIASRQHQKNMIPIIEQALKEAEVTLDDIEAIAVTYGPGLVGSLLIGLNTAKGIAYSKNIPLIGVNHIEGHIFANFIGHPSIEPPLVVLVVSGGHTELVHMKSFGHYELVGKTRDDAAGECIDKVSKMLGLGFPGGRIIDEKAKEGDRNFHKFPRGMKNSLDFSFSGLKTAVKIYIEEKGEDFVRDNMNNICASFQEAVVEVLAQKTVRAAKECGVDTIMMAGGVSANSRLRFLLSEMAEKAGLKLYYPHPKYCTDNAAMIAACGYYHLKNGEKSELDLDAVSNLKLAE